MPLCGVPSDDIEVYMRNQILVFFVTLLSVQAAESQISGSIQINSSANVHFIVTDPSGNRTGVDPRGTPTDKVYGVTFIREILRANYSFAGNDALDGTASSESHEFTFNFISPDDDGVYTLQAIGTRLSTFLIDSYVLRDDGGNYKSSRFKVGGVIDKDSVVSYRFTCFGNAAKKLVFEKVVNASSLARDIAAMRRLHWITNHATATKYANLIVAYSRYITRKKMTAAKTTLATMIDGISADSLHGLTIDACKHLRRDLESLSRRPLGSQ